MVLSPVAVAVATPATQDEVVSSAPAQNLGHAAGNLGLPLSAEQWDQVVRLLVDDGAARTVASLALTCRALCRVAFPYTKVMQARALDEARIEASPQCFDPLLAYFAPSRSGGPSALPGDARSEVAAQLGPSNVQRAWGVGALGRAMAKLQDDEPDAAQRQWHRFKRLLDETADMNCKDAGLALRGVGMGASGLATDTDHGFAIVLMMAIGQGRSTGRGDLMAGAVASLADTTGVQLAAFWSSLLAESRRYTPEERAVALTGFAACVADLPAPVLTACSRALIRELERLEPEDLRVDALHELGLQVAEVLTQCGRTVGLLFFGDVLKACDRLGPRSQAQALPGPARAISALPASEEVPVGSPLGRGEPCPEPGAVADGHQACLALLHRAARYDDAGKAACLSAMAYALPLLASRALHEALFEDLLLRTLALDAAHRFDPLLQLACALDGLPADKVVATATRLRDAAHALPDPDQAQAVLNALERASERIGGPAGNALRQLLEAPRVPAGA